MKRSLFFYIVIVALLFFPSLLKAQVQLIPTTIVLDRSGVGTVMVVNTSDEPREISISTEFSYNVSDSLGFSVDAEDYSELETYDISENLLIYPPRFVLGGGERRDIRVQHRMGPGMPDGGYFSRFIVKAEPMAQDAVQEEDPETISVQLNYVFVQDIPLYHFYGDATTGIEIRNMTLVEPEDDPDSFILVFDMDKKGNAPYRGSVDIVIKDESGDVVVEENRQVGLFTDRKIGLRFNKEEFTAQETYTADFTFQTKRTSSSPQDLVQAPDVKYSNDFTLRE